MSNNEHSSCRKWCRKSWIDVWAMFKRFIIIIIAQLVGWAIFSYVEDDLNVIDCFINPIKVADNMYPLSNETEKATALFYKLYNKTGQVLTFNQSAEIYSVFRAYFNVPIQEPMLSDDRALRGCVKWYRFSAVTMTTIGKIRHPMIPVGPILGST